jgi:CheY-like chemotaxis protein
MINHTILLVEDNEDDVFLMRRALDEARVTAALQIVEDGQQAVDYLSGAGKYSNRYQYPLPKLVFLDLKLPLKSGHEVLTWIRQQPDFESLVVIVLTSSDQPTDIRTSYRLGANSYLVKPPPAEQLLDLAKAFKLFWLNHNRFDSPPDVIPSR